MVFLKNGPYPGSEKTSRRFVDSFSSKIRIRDQYSSVLLFSAKVEERHQGAGGGVAAVRGGAAAAGGAGQRAGRAGGEGGQGQAGAPDQAPVTPGDHRRHQDRAAVPGAGQLVIMKLVYSCLKITLVQVPLSSGQLFQCFLR